MLNKKFKFTSSKLEKIKISLIVTLGLVFILLFLKPFDMFSYIPKNKWYLYFGYGLSLFFAHLATIFVEDKIYIKQERNWYIKNEILIKLFYFLIGSLFIYLYHFLFVKTFQRPWTNFPVFVYKYTLPFFIILLPIMVFFRKINGEIYSIKLEKVELSGTNKKEKVELLKKSILFVKSENNYVTVFYLDDEIVKKIILRNTLANISNQANFLMKSHRSYLVNSNQIKSLKGNSQNAFLLLNSFDQKIPVSKTYFKDIEKSIN